MDAKIQAWLDKRRVALGAFRYIMAWRPRMGGDPAHNWLREAVLTALNS